MCYIGIYLCYVYSMDEIIPCNLGKSVYTLVRGRSVHSEGF